MLTRRPGRCAPGSGAAWSGGLAQLSGGLPPRSVALRASPGAVVYTDAQGGGRIVAYAWRRDESAYIHCHAPMRARRENGVFVYELLGVLSGLELMREWRPVESILMNVDNQGGLYSLIRGTCSDDLGIRLRQAFWRRAAPDQLGPAPWIWPEFVNSESNIADFPSRMCSLGASSALGEERSPACGATQAGAEDVNTEVPTPEERATPWAFIEMTRSWESLSDTADGGGIAARNAPLSECPGRQAPSEEGERRPTRSGEKCSAEAPRDGVRRTPNDK